jgi:hypothetical protein
MVTEKNFVSVSITKEDIEEAKGIVFQRSIRARSPCEKKTTAELEEIVRLQIWMHEYSSVGSKDDVELCVCKGILVEDRDYSWDDIERLWYGVKMECRRNGMEYQYYYLGKPGGVPDSVDYSNPHVEIRTSNNYIELSGNELAECYL